LYVTGVNRNSLYHNNRNGTFTDVTDKAGPTGIDGTGKKLLSVSAAWVDYDNDGQLDLFVTNYLDWTPENSRVCGPVGRRLSCPPSLYTGQPNLLYHNNGDGTFTDVSEAMGISRHRGKGMGVAIADFDGDGWMDIFVANDNERNFLFHNNHGKSFDEVGVEAGVAYTEDGIPVSSMGVGFADYRNDGKPGILITALGGELRQAFSNLISNAIDAMPAGGTLILRATQSHSRNGANRPGVRVTILDTGEGIAPQHRKNLFQPFFTTKEDVGTGLGLWITRCIVEKHGGSIRVKSRTGTEDHGTAFSVFLPLDGKPHKREQASLAGMASASSALN